MNTFHSSVRRVTKITIFAKETELAMRMEHCRNIILLPPEAGDQSDQVDDNEELAQDMHSAFEPGRTLEVEKRILVDDILDPYVSTYDAAATTFPSLIMICQHQTSS